jgi:hypothetical protein
MGFIRFQTEWNRLPRNGRDSVARQPLETVPEGERGRVSEAFQNGFRETVPKRFRNGVGRTPLVRGWKVVGGRSGFRQGRDALQRQGIATSGSPSCTPSRSPSATGRGLLVVGCGCRCVSHCDFGVPGLSFGRLIQPPAALCVCVTVLVARFARSTNPLLGRSRPRFRSHKAAGATAPAPRPRSRGRRLAAARPTGRVKSPPMFC